MEENDVQELERAIRQEFQVFSRQKQVADRLMEEYEMRQNNVLQLQARAGSLEAEIKSIQGQVQMLKSMTAQSAEDVAWLRRQLQMLRSRLLQANEELKETNSALDQNQKRLQELDPDRKDLGIYCVECGKRLRVASEKARQELAKCQKTVQETSAILPHRFGSAQARKTQPAGMATATRYQKCIQEIENLVSGYIQLAARLLQVTQEDAIKEAGEYVRPFTTDPSKKR